jgi:hypothetical protein
MKAIKEMAKSPNQGRTHSFCETSLAPMLSILGVEATNHLEIAPGAPRIDSVIDVAL